MKNLKPWHIILGLVLGTFLAIVLLGWMGGKSLADAIGGAFRTVKQLAKTIFNPLNWIRLAWANLKLVGRIFTLGPSKALFEYKTDVYEIYMDSNSDNRITN